ncbi:MAG: sulfurtransferase TusA family protein [Candidatus Hodarchaeales archaeon]|jgi:tRNA 2-thiouridine synthesizing protein A
MTEIAQTLDAKNTSCPIPILKAKKALKGLEIGQVLEVLATDPGSMNDMAAWARTTGQELLSSEEQDGKPKVYRFLVKRQK